MGILPCGENDVGICPVEISPVGNLPVTTGTLSQFFYPFAAEGPLPMQKNGQR